MAAQRRQRCSNGLFRLTNGRTNETKLKMPRPKLFTVHDYPCTGRRLLSSPLTLRA